jgi:hypothetical protein
MRKKKDHKEVIDLLTGKSREVPQLNKDLDELEKLPAEFQEFKDVTTKLSLNVKLIELAEHLKDLEHFGTRFEKLKYLEHLSLEHIFDNFY